MSKIKIWIEATRPKIFTASIVPVIIANAAAYYHISHKSIPCDGENINFLIAFITLICAMMIQLVSNFYNDIYDFYNGADTAERKGPKRLVAEGIIPLKTMIKVTTSLVIITFLLGLVIVNHAGWEILVVGIISLIAAWAYTGGPFPIAYNSLGEVFVIVFFGLVAVNGAFYVQTLTFTPDVFLMSIIPGLLASNILNVNNIRDIETDAKVGKRTLASRLGRKNAIIMYDILLVLSYLSVIGITHLLQSFILFLPFLTLPFAYKISRNLHTLPDEKLNIVLIQSGIFMLIFGILLVLGYLFS